MLWRFMQIRSASLLNLHIYQFVLRVFCQLVCCSLCCVCLCQHILIISSRAAFALSYLNLICIAASAAAARDQDTNQKPKPKTEPKMKTILGSPLIVFVSESKSEWQHCERRSLINKDAIKLGSLRYIKGSRSCFFSIYPLTSLHPWGARKAIKY